MAHSFQHGYGCPHRRRPVGPVGAARANRGQSLLPQPPPGDERVTAGPGDFVNVPRGRVHNFHNAGSAVARLILTFTPAGIERFFEETLERAPDPTQPPPDNAGEVAARYAEAAPRSGMEFLVS
jgi:Cupin domain